MKQVTFKIIFVVFLSFLSASCAIHQPMSEMVMFQEKRAHSDSTYFSKYSHSIASASTDHFLESEIVKYARENYSEDRELGYDNPSSLTTNLIFLNQNHQRFGLSIALGPLVMGTGIDATYNIFEKYYLTAAGGMGRDFRDYQYQFILQRKLLDGNPLGLSIGTVFRNRYRYVGIPVNYLGADNIDFYTTSFGLRSVFTYSPITEYGSSRLFIHGTGSFNYDVTLNTFYPKIGISIGIY